MEKKFTLAVTGDTILNRRISVYGEERFLSLIKIIRDADVAYTHFEMLIHDYDGPEIYPAAQAGGTWMRAPCFVADELKWAGFDIVSLASNHSMDYSYGGLFNTFKVLDKAGLVHAGTGRKLGEAKEPAYLETGKGRVALISMSSTFTSWAAAGEARRDIKGRPGLNPLRYYHVVDSDTIETLKEVYSRVWGWEVMQYGKVWLFIPPGLYNKIYKFVVGEKPRVYRVAEESDVEANLRSIKDARRQADYVLVHVHYHEWELGKGMEVPAEFIPPFARKCIDAGADAFIGQGAHTLRGIEIYKNKPIFYDPGDFLSMSITTTKLPADFYWNSCYGECTPEMRGWEATPADAFDARILARARARRLPERPPSEVRGAVVANCIFGEKRRLAEMKLYPVTMIREPRSQTGRPILADAEMAKKIINYMRELSSPYGTEIEFKDGIGLVMLEE